MKSDKQPLLKMKSDKQPLEQTMQGTALTIYTSGLITKVKFRQPLTLSFCKRRLVDLSKPSPNSTQSSSKVTLTAALPFATRKANSKGCRSTILRQDCGIRPCYAYVPRCAFLTGYCAMMAFFSIGCRARWSLSLVTKICSPPCNGEL